MRARRESFLHIGTYLHILARGNSFAHTLDGGSHPFYFAVFSSFIFAPRVSLVGRSRVVVITSVFRSPSPTPPSNSPQDACLSLPHYAPFIFRALRRTDATRKTSQSLDRGFTELLVGLVCIHVKMPKSLETCSKFSHNSLDNVYATILREFCTLKHKTRRKNIYKRFLRYSFSLVMRVIKISILLFFYSVWRIYLDRNVCAYQSERSSGYHVHLARYASRVSPRVQP